MRNGYRMFHGRENWLRVYKRDCVAAGHAEPLCASCLAEFERHMAGEEQALKDRAAISQDEQV